MNKKIKTDLTDFEIGISTATIVTIGIFKFIKDEEYPWVDIYMTGGEKDEFIEQVDIRDEITLDEIRTWAVNWVFNNVEVTKEVKAE